MQELASFLISRSYCWQDAGNHRLQVEALAYASAIAPGNIYYRHTLNKALNDWTEKLESRRPPRFPCLEIAASKRRFPSALPLKTEQDILAMEAMENLLNDANHDRALWTPLRQGRANINPPVRAVAAFKPEGGCNIRFRFDWDLSFPATIGNFD